MNDQLPLTRVSDDDPGLSAYEEDFSVWIDSQVHLLREKKFDQLDLENVIEEFVAIGRSEKRELSSRIRVLLTHLLKYQFQPEKISEGWIGTMNEQRAQIKELLKTSPSLRRLVGEYAQRSFADARVHAAIETQLPVAAFPLTIPYSVEQILDYLYFP